MINELKLFDEFNEALANYSVSQDARAVLADVKLVLLHAPSSTGRNTIIRELIKTDKYHFIVSDTTRKPRINDGEMERTGIEYHFRSEEEVLEDIKNGLYIEAEVIHGQQVSGVSIRELNTAKMTGRIPITDVDMQGVENIMKVKSDAIPIYILPPDFDTWMKRLMARGELDQDEIRRRLETAEMILEKAIDKKYFYFVINDDLNTAVDDVRGIVERGEFDDSHRENGEKVAWDILGRLKTELNS